MAIDLNNPYQGAFDNPEYEPIRLNPLNPYSLDDFKGKSIGTYGEYVGGNGYGESKFDTNIGIQDLPNLQKIRAERQPWYEQAGAAINQAVVGEVIGGTLMSVGAILDAPEMVANNIQQSDDDFHNFVYDLGKGLSDWTQEATPIYQSGDRFGDSGWWFQNGVSIASSLSMLLPGMAAAKVGRGISKGLGLGRTATDIIGTTVGALTMRHAEGFREASGVYDSIYQQGLQAMNEGRLPEIKSEEELRKVASDAAALDYNLNYLNTAFDFIQLGAILKPFKNLTRNAGLLEYDLAKQVGRLPKSKLGKAAYWMAEPGKGILEQTSEGFEEVVNTIAQFEGERKGKLDLGLEKDDGSTVSERVMDYLGRPETTDSFIWGTLGGVAFKALGKPVAKALGLPIDNTLEKKLAEVNGRENTIRQFAEHYNAINNGEVVRGEDGTIINDYSKTTQQQRDELTIDLKNKMAFRLGLDAAQAGNVDLLLAQLDDRDFQNKLIESGVTTQESIGKDIQVIKQEVENAESTYSKYFQRLYELPVDDKIKRQLLNQTIQTDYRRNSALDGIKELELEYNKLYNEDGFIKVNATNPNLGPTLQMESLVNAIGLVNRDIEEAKKTNNTYAIEQNEKIKKNLEKKLNSIPKHEHINPKLIDVRIPHNLAQQEILKEYANLFSENIANIDSKENINKVTEEATNLENEITAQINEVKKQEEIAKKQERISKQQTAKWNKLIDKAVNNKELDSIIDQMDKVGVTSNELLDKVAVKRESLKVQPEVKEEPTISLNEFETGFEPDNTDLATLLKETSIDVDTEIKSEELSLVNTDPEYYDSAKDKQVNEEFDKLEEDLNNANGSKTLDSDGSIVYDNKKIENGYNALAHQDRKYERVKKGNTVEYIDVTNELNPDAPLELLSPGKYPIGTEVEFIVTDKDDLDIYDPDSKDKETITWAVYKKRLQDRSSIKDKLVSIEQRRKDAIIDAKNRYPENEIESAIKEINSQYDYEIKRAKEDGIDITTLQDYKNNVPIQLKIGEKIFNAYLHSVPWINEENVTGDVVQDGINLRNIRNGIVEKGSYKTTIEEVSNGVLFTLKDKARHSVKDAVGEDTNFTIGVSTGAGIKTGKSKMFKESLINTPKTSGITYLIVKVQNGNNMAIPVRGSKIGINPNKESIKASIVNAIDAYLTDNEALRDEIRDITGLNILQLNDLEYFLKMYLGFYNTQGKFLRDIITTIPHETGNTYFTVHSKTIEFFDGDLVTGEGRVYSVSKNKQEQKELFLNKLMKSLDNFYLNNSIEAFDSNEIIPIFDEQNNLVPKPYRELIMESFTTNVKGNKVDEINGKPIYSYNLQPVYRFNFNEFLPKEEVVENITIEKPAEEIKSKEDIKSKKARLRAARNNFNSLGTTPNPNFDKDINNSHKKC